MRFTFHLTQNLQNSSDYSVFMNLVEELWSRMDSEENEIKILCSEQAVYLLMSPNQILQQLNSQPKTSIYIHKSHCKSLLNKKNTHDLQYSHPEFHWLEPDEFYQIVSEIIENPDDCYLKF